MQVVVGEDGAGWEADLDALSSVNQSVTRFAEAFPPTAGNRRAFGGNNSIVKGSKDRRLVARICKGDSEALADLYDSHAALLALRLRRQGASTEEAQDVLQETFIDVWRTATSYRGDGEVGAWLWGIASRKYLMLIRGEIRLRRREETVTGDEGSEESDDDWASSMDAETAVDKLSPDLQEAFRAVAIEGFSVADAARHLGAPEGTIKSRVHRARQALRKELR